MSVKKNVFISHHHKDDTLVDKMTSLLSKNDFEIRNSSIRAKPANQERLDKGLVKDSTIKRLLRMKMSWAGTVIVLVGKETHTRPWVNWEIKEAQRQGKNIVGVYEQGLKDKVELPEALKVYGTSQVGWNAESIINAVNGNSTFQNPDGSPSPRQDGNHAVC
ncbi:MAG: TIR domain-containing protein [Gallionellaceae bacterium]